METGGIDCSHLLPTGPGKGPLCSQTHTGRFLALDLWWGLAIACGQADADPAGLSQTVHFELPLAFYRQISGM